MTMLEKVIAFAEALPADRREAVEETLAALMESWSAEYDFTPKELAELDRRVAEPRAQYSDPSDITRIFGKPFRS